MVQDFETFINEGKALNFIKKFFSGNKKNDYKSEIDIDYVLNNFKEKYDKLEKDRKDIAIPAITAQDLVNSFKKKYDNFINCPDKDMVKIIIWFGINYQDDLYSFYSFFFNPLIDECKDQNILKNKKDSINALYAAWPQSGMEDELAEFNVDIDDVKSVMKKYFPWRLDGDKIKYCDSLDD